MNPQFKWGFMRTRVRAGLARAHLFSSEWLRRQNRRVDLREQFRAAHDMLNTIGIEAFTERARRELLVTGGLTAQEAQIARLAGDRRTSLQDYLKDAWIEHRSLNQPPCPFFTQAAVYV